MKNITITIIGAIALIIGIIIISNINYHEEEVKCYDRFSNEIEGLNCTEEIPNNYFLFGLSIILIMCGAMFGLVFGLMPGMMFGWFDDMMGGS